MLTLTRRMGEKIFIGDNIIIKVLGTKLGQVRLGIEAPRKLAVHREEVYQRILAQQAETARAEDQPSSSDTPKH